MKILVVDPSFIMRRNLVKTLVELKFEKPVEAADGVEAFNLIRDKSFDLVLTEWNMPLMDGVGLLKSIRRNENLRNTKLIFVTKASRKGNVVKAYQAKADGFIAKPYTGEILLKKINEIMNHDNSEVSNILNLQED